MLRSLIFIFGVFTIGCTAFNTPLLPTPLLPTDYTVADEILSASSDNIARTFEKEYLAYMKTGIESPTLQQISHELAQSHSRDLITKDLFELRIEDQFIACTLCRATISVIADIFRNDTSPAHNEELAKQFVLDVCTRFNIYTQEVCLGVFDSHYEMVVYIVRNTAMHSNEFCSIFMEWNFCNIKSPEYLWTIQVDSTGGSVTGPKSDLPTKTSNDYRILQLTDIHHDPLYEPYSLAECEEPLCCQRNKSTSQGTSKAAGYWGDYRDCDAPLHTIRNAFQNIKTTHTDIDFIYQTGDVIDHMVWATSREKNKDVLSSIYNTLYEYFPDTPVYSTIGNHEPHPLNDFSPEDVPEAINTKWLYEHLYSLWSKWLPADTKETILKGGYYTVSPRSGFRIISLNSIDCYTDNFWIYYGGTNMIPQLDWFHDTLLKAEKAGEYVHVLAHIPSGDGTCWSGWSREYNRIVERFRNTIGGIFNGHSHNDDMCVHYSATGHAIALSWNGGALTTYSFKNPNYRLYDVDPKTLQVLDHETWIFNLTAANAIGESQSPVWFKEYDFSTAFTKDLSPAGIDKLLDEMAENPSLLRKYWMYKMTSADPKMEEGCNRGCLKSTLCRIATTVNDQKTRCNDLTAKLDIALDNESTDSSTSSTSSSTSTEATTEEDEDDDDDGAASLVAFSLSSILAVCFGMKYLM